MSKFLSLPFLTSKDLYSPEGLLDFESEKDLVSIFYLCRAQLLLFFILEYLSTGDRLQLFRLGPIYILPQRYIILRDECNSIMIKKNTKVICVCVISSFIGRYKFYRILIYILMSFFSFFRVSPTRRNLGTKAIAIIYLVHLSSN